MTPSPRLLSLEAVEDRTLPSPFYPTPIAPYQAYTAAHRADFFRIDTIRFEPRETSGPSAHANPLRGESADEAGRAAGRVSETFVVVWLTPPAVGGRVTNPPPAQPTAADRTEVADRPTSPVTVVEPTAEYASVPLSVRQPIGEPPAAIQTPPQPTVEAGHRSEQLAATRPTVVVPALPTVAAPSAVAANLPTRVATAPLSAPAALTDQPNATQPIGSQLAASTPMTAAVSWPDTDRRRADAAPVLTAPPSFAENQPEMPTAPPAPVTPAVESLPMPSVVGRVIEVVFPVGGPLSGALAVDLVAVEADAAGLLAGLAGLGDGAADGWGSPERWAWLTAAALTAGGVGYAAAGHIRGRRRTGPVAMATDSALARWEERHGDGTS